MWWTKQNYSTALTWKLQAVVRLIMVFQMTLESEGNAGLVNFQQSVCCEVHLGLQKKKDEFVGLYYYCFCINRQGSRCLSEICVNRPETLRILRQWNAKSVAYSIHGNIDEFTIYNVSRRK